MTSHNEEHVESALSKLRAAANSSLDSSYARIPKDQAAALLAELSRLATDLFTTGAALYDEQHGITGTLRNDEMERLRGIQPEMPPRCEIHDDTPVEGLPRYGLRWNGPTSPLSVPMPQGYWTPWHLAAARIRELEQRQALGEREG